MYNSPEGIFYLATNPYSIYGQGRHGMEELLRQLAEKGKYKTTFLDKLFDSHVPDNLVNGLAY